MDAQTLTVDSDNTAAENIAPEKAISLRLNEEFGGRSQSQLEQECRQYIQRSATAALEVGKRLLVLREMTLHGEWIETLGRIGIARSTAHRLMTAATRFCRLGSTRLVEAAESKTKLFELLVLDDDELQTLETGGSIQGLSTGSIAAITVKQLREKLRGIRHMVKADGTEIRASKNTRIDELKRLGLQPGDRIKTILSERLGKVVRTYADGSACICWDDGEPQPEGLGHERMPRQLLELVEQVSTAPVLPPGAEPILSGGLNASTSTHLPDSEPARELQLEPSDFHPTRVAGQAVCKVFHNGRYWLEQSDLASLLSRHCATFDEVWAIRQAIGHAFDSGFPGEGYATARLRGEDVPLRLFGEEAVRGLCETLGTDDAQEVHAWFRGEAATAELIQSANDNAEALPAVYSLLPGDFDGHPVSLVQHAGRAWLTVNEVAAILGETSEGTSEVTEIIASALHYDPSFPADGYAQVRLASTGLVLHLLDGNAVGYLCQALDTGMAHRLREWFQDSPATGAVVGEAPASAPTKEQRDMMGTLYNRVEDALGLSLLADYRCAEVITDPADRCLAESALVGTLVPLLREARGLMNRLEVSLHL